MDFQSQINHGIQVLLKEQDNHKAKHGQFSKELGTISKNLCDSIQSFNDYKRAEKEK